LGSDSSDWEVGLVEISFVNALKTIDQECIHVELSRRKVQHETHIYSLGYLKDLVKWHTIQYIGQDCYMIETRPTYSGEDWHIDYDVSIKRYVFTCDLREGKVTIDPLVAAQLGFHPATKGMNLADIFNDRNKLGTYEVINPSTKKWIAPNPPAFHMLDEKAYFILEEKGVANINTSFFFKDASKPDTVKTIEHWNKYRTEHAKIPSGHYKNSTDLSKAINGSGLEVHFKITFDYSAATNRFTCNIPRERQTEDEKVTISLEAGAEVILGFEELKLHSTTTAKHPPDLRRGIYSLYIYCDVCSEMLVGNALVPLLRNVSFPTSAFGETISIVYNNPIYTTCMKSHIDTIGVKICDDSGRLVPFIEGKTVITLHFRKRL